MPKEEITKTAVAQLKYFRMSGRKVRPILKSFKGKKVEEVLAYLKFTPTRAATYLTKLVNSAVSNAKNKGLEETKLVVQGFTYDDGPFLKRFRPGYRGIAFPYKRRLGHIKVVLIEAEESKFESKKEKKMVSKIVSPKKKEIKKA